MTKKQVRERNRQWREALAESRVLKFNNGLTMKSYPTQAEREIAYAQAIAAGINVERIHLPLEGAQ